ncbi:aminoglycoside phosphotransferase family protein [Polycladidibacter hongkongensis]|uniref:aminoglycoside phosphotransferase family protein n=1 Tax=Polycladidibacter hongkongensis TaxID=1647556 RepID=UPI0008329D5D|nr:aminoglycoside phosphotransferase family protein [Pseudovibrio hongkongensis]
MSLSQDLLNEFSAHSPSHVTDTNIASVWRVKLADGNSAAVKLYKDDNFQDEAPGFDLLVAQDGLGAARVYARTNSAVLMEWLDGSSPGDLTRGGDDRAATEALIETANQLHQMPSREIPSLDPLENRFRALLEARFTADCPQKTEATVRAAAVLAKKLLATQTNIRPLHGDFHHDNIKGSERGYLAFDAKGVLGEHTFELANAFRNPVGAEEFYRRPETILKRAAVWSAGLQVTQNHLLSWAAAYSALSLSWTHSSSFGPDSSKDVELIETFLYLL